MDNPTIQKWVPVIVACAKIIDGDDITPCGCFKQSEPRVVDGQTLYGSPELIGTKSWEECFDMIDGKPCLWYNTRTNTTRLLILDSMTLPKEVEELV